MSFDYLNYIDNNFRREDFDRLIKEQISLSDHIHQGDLTFGNNWSYPMEETSDYLNEKIIFHENNISENFNENIPEEFKAVGTWETEYYMNKRAFTNLKVLILRDSSLFYLKDILSTYFKETLLYFDHLFFNKELIEWYKPDIILEIRTERFLENIANVNVKNNIDLSIGLNKHHNRITHLSKGFTEHDNGLNHLSIGLAEHHNRITHLSKGFTEHDNGLNHLSMD